MIFDFFLVYYQIDFFFFCGLGVKKNEDRGTRIMRVVGNYLKKLLTKFWIWVVAITLFGVAIAGERMTAFRIIYMALFLFFVLTFQVR